MSSKVLIARLDSLGDVLICGPAIRAVAQHAEVVFLCGPRGEAAARLLPGISSILVWDCPWIAAHAPDVDGDDVTRFVDDVRGLGVSEAIILTSFHQSPLPLALLFRLAGIARITAASSDYPGSLLDVRLRPGEDFPEMIHEVTRALTIVGAAGYPSSDDALALRDLPDSNELTGPEPYIVLHPGASVPSRMWPLGGFVRAARMLCEIGHRVVITGDSGEVALTRQIAQAVPDVIDLGGSCNLGELAAVLSRASVVVVGNTGPAHLAAATGTPVVSLFSPVVPFTKWAPFGVPLIALGDQEAPCKETRAKECPVEGHPCLARVRPEEVVRAVLELEARTGDDDAHASRHAMQHSSQPTERTFQ